MCDSLRWWWLDGGHILDILDILCCQIFLFSHDELLHAYRSVLLQPSQVLLGRGR